MVKPTIDNLLAGDEAIGNDKGYELSTHEKQAEFARKRNYHISNTDNPRSISTTYYREDKMNERIKELAEQATKKYDRLGNEIPFAQPDLENFAELIVRECVHQVLTGIKCNPPQAEPPEIAKTLARRLQQHFGVKE